VPIVINKPFVRFELRYGRYLTIIEGKEMELLDHEFRRSTEYILANLKKFGLIADDPELPFVVSMLASIQAYHDLYGMLPTEKEMKKLSTPDARKLDLFYRGMLIQLRLALYPEEDWTKLYDDWDGGLLNAAGRYCSCFISYSAKDQRFVERLYRDLRKNGVRCWFAPHDMPISAKILDEVNAAIRVREKVLLVLSKAAIGSDWVEDEVTGGL
jgi:hypothetical protein